ncbi:hypothetical protein [Aedoeadaptatus urinae]|uniref:hypothetical protein n=1 Tax=Aedoeadaptatus urinae TaxID=1871017 RepID=UPI00097D56EC|nr:hypothetical protein [Peptoniphilus urinae]
MAEDRAKDARRVFSPSRPISSAAKGNDRENKMDFPETVFFKIIGKRLFFSRPAMFKVRFFTRLLFFSNDLHLYLRRRFGQ